jgi:translation initiation factor eIF-2B subunit alpha
MVGGSANHNGFLVLSVISAFLFQYHSSTLKAHVDLKKEHPLVDYTPPAYITLLFTDLGVLTPSAVSDELIKLYL